MTTPRPDVFLSYSREDQATARRYAESLKKEGFSVWWDQTLATGEAYDAVTEQALDSARSVVVLWSKTSVTSRWVRAEATTADRNGVLMPVMIEACRRPVMFELMQTAELGDWKGDANEPAWRAFVADLKRLVLRGQPPEAAVLFDRSAQQAGAPSERSGPSVAGARNSRSSPVLKIVSAAVVAGLLVAGYLGWQHMQRVKQAREAVPAIARLVDAGDFPAAYARAQEVRRVIPDDSLLKSLTPLFTAVYAITSTPPGAEVFVRGYDDVKGQWQSIGHAPLARVELPRRAMRWRFEKAGFQTLERANTVLGYQSGIGTYLADEVGKLDVTLRPDGDQMADMVDVPGGSTSFVLNRLPPEDVQPFLIDRHETTNAAYKEFVDAGGYERRSWWEGLDIRKSGKPLAFEEAMPLFVDATGRPGPAGWELGSHPEGKGSFPVAGVSWYEAMAYARYRGKTLPTLYHWAQAARLGDGSLAASTAPLSNLGTAGPAPVGQFQGAGPYGTSDLYGNVREWILNTGPGGGGWVVGGSWEDPSYSYASTAAATLLERSSLNGFRLVKDIVEPVNGPALRATLDLAIRGRPDLASLKPVSEETYATLLRQFAYTPGPLDATAPITMTTTEDWIKQRVTINAGYNDERMDVILFVPRRTRPPFQPVILFSGSQTFRFPATVDSIEPGFAAMPVDYIVKSGRMIVQPVFQGSFERLKKPIDLEDQVQMTRTLTEWRWDLGRTIDYLATRTDVDAARVGYIGLSLGASVVPLLAVEPRLKAAVLQSGGLDGHLRAPVLDPVNFAPRLRIPVLMVNGQYDEFYPVETYQVPLFDLLGSPPGSKRHVILDSGHGSLPRGEVLRETLAWYDKYLGEVRQ